MPDTRKVMEDITGLIAAGQLELTGRLVWLWFDTATVDIVDSVYSYEADADVCDGCDARMLPGVAAPVCGGCYTLCPTCAQDYPGCNHPEHWNED